MISGVHIQGTPKTYILSYKKGHKKASHTTIAKRTLESCIITTLPDCVDRIFACFWHV